MANVICGAGQQPSTTTTEVIITTPFKGLMELHPSALDKYVGGTIDCVVHFPIDGASSRHGTLKKVDVEARTRDRYTPAARFFIFEGTVIKEAHNDGPIARDRKLQELIFVPVDATPARVYMKPVDDWHSHRREQVCPPIFDYPQHSLRIHVPDNGSFDPNLNASWQFVETEFTKDGATHHALLILNPQGRHVDSSNGPILLISPKAGERGGTMGDLLLPKPA